MKKYISYILLFFVAVVLIDQLVGLAGDYMQHHSKPSPNSQFDDLCLKDKHDVLIMGSSRARHHYVPQILEDSLKLDVYNAGYDGNGIILSYGILQMITERYVPKCIIFDVTSSFDIYENTKDDNRTRYLSFLKPYYRHDQIAKELWDVSRRTYLMSFSGFYRYNSEFLNLIKMYLNGGNTFTKGYAPLYNDIQNETNGVKIDSNLVEDNIKIKYLCKFINCCKSNGICLILALSPEYKVTDEKMKAFVHKFADQNCIPVIDFYSDDFFQNDMTLFNDGSHLNDRGAKLFTQKIVPLIEDYMQNY